MATNEAGVVAGLTNRPLRDGPDAAKRSRGELPLALARQPTAAVAVEAFGNTIDPGAYNPSWLLVADREDAFFVDVTGTDRVVVEHLPPGVHVLENRNVHEPSPKVGRVRELLDPVLAGPPTELVDRLAELLADHLVPTPNRRPTAATRAWRWPPAPSASTPTRTTTAPARLRSSPWPTSSCPRRSAGPAMRRAAPAGRRPNASGRHPAPNRGAGGDPRRARGSSPPASARRHGAPTAATDRSVQIQRAMTATPACCSQRDTVVGAAGP